LILVAPIGGRDHAHGPAYRVEEGSARIFDQVPAIGDLDGVRQRLRGGLAIATAAVSRYDPDPWVVGKLRLNRCDLAIH
jgi:hypothetical protein